jgi:uncharacterized repeat protein (TIGR03803 family)
MTVVPASAGTSLATLLKANQRTPERVMHSFQGFYDGAEPRSALVSNGHAGFFGTTEFGGTGCNGGCGTVFRVTPRATGGYDEHIVHRFFGAEDGTNPEAGLVADARGALYGTTATGGPACFPPGCGTVYKLTPQGNGGFRESVIYAFTNGKDGGSPTASLLVDARGDLVGTASGGKYGNGVVFELSPSGNTYSLAVLYSFGATPGDGSNPSGALIADAQGNLYGLTGEGGSSSVGTAFRLAPGPNGYAETILHNFSGGSDGASPDGALAFGPNGNLYGTTYLGGIDGAGVVFALMPTSKSNYAEKTIQPFTTIGAEPAAGVIVDKHGVLYGTTAFGGLPGCSNGGGCGIVFSLTPVASGFQYDILHVFGGGRDGSEPYAGLSFGPHDALFGTTLRGGTGNYGTVFSVQ